MDFIELLYTYMDYDIDFILSYVVNRLPASDLDVIIITSIVTIVLSLLLNQLYHHHYCYHYYHYYC